MTVDTAPSDNTQADSEKIFTFPRGIPGFEKYTKYILFHKEEDNNNAYWLESCDTPGVTFTLVEPGQYGLSYELELTEEEQDLLQTEDAKTLGVFLVLSKGGGTDTKTTGLNANITGPIIINAQNRLGLQKVLQKSHLSTLIVED